MNLELEKFTIEQQRCEMYINSYNTKLKNTKGPYIKY